MTTKKVSQLFQFHSVFWQKSIFSKNSTQPYPLKLDLSEIFRTPKLMPPFYNGRKSDKWNLNWTHWSKTVNKWILDWASVPEWEWLNSNSIARQWMHNTNCWSQSPDIISQNQNFWPNLGVKALNEAEWGPKNTCKNMFNILSVRVFIWNQNIIEKKSII